jgi:hypothetical protein
MSAVASLCSRGMVIDAGRIIKDGDAKTITSEYLSMLYNNIETTSDLDNVERYGNGKARFTAVTIIPIDKNSNPQEIFSIGQNVKIILEIIANESIYDTNVALIIYERMGYRLIDANLALKNSCFSLLKGQKAKIIFILQNVLLQPGVYLLGLWIGRSNIEDIDGITYAKQFSIEIDPDTTEASHNFPGVYLCDFTYSVEIC